VSAPRPASKSAAGGDENEDAPVFPATRRLELNIAPVFPAAAAAAAEAAEAGPFEPTSFTADELEALSGRYRVVVAVPGFDCVGLRVGGRRVAVVSPGGEPLTRREGAAAAARDDDDDGGEGSGYVDLGPSLWPSPESNRRESAPHAVSGRPSTLALVGGPPSPRPRLTALVVEAELAFKPIPVRYTARAVFHESRTLSRVQPALHKSRQRGRCLLIELTCTSPSVVP
jgi:hypothetical protein